MALPDELERANAYSRSDVEIRRNRRRLARVLILFFTFVPAVFLASQVQEELAIVVALGWIVAAAAALISLSWSSCPRCHQACFADAYRESIWSSKCRNCGAKLYE
jgi:hypothetical protein